MSVLHRPRLMVAVVAAVLAVAVPALLISAGCMASGTGPHQLWSVNNLKQLGLALYTYHDEYGTFPPAVVRDADGRPMHSWRVLILPYMEGTELYAQYDFSQPWDSEHNLQLARQMPDVYSGRDYSSDDRTRFVAVVGDGMAWPASGANSLDSFEDGLSDTILVMELPERTVLWTEPTDFDVDTAGVVPLANSNEIDVVNVLLADGAVQGVPADASLKRLMPAFTSAAGDVVDKKLLGDAAYR